MRLIKPENKSWHAQGSAWRGIRKTWHLPPSCSLFNKGSSLWAGWKKPWRESPDQCDKESTDTSWKQQDGDWLAQDSAWISKCQNVINKCKSLVGTWSTQPMGKWEGVGMGEDKVEKLHYCIHRHAPACRMPAIAVANTICFYQRYCPDNYFYSC